MAELKSDQVVTGWQPQADAIGFLGYFSGGPPALSPDGRRLAFAATTAEGKTLLFIRPLDSASAQPLAGTEGASYPFWSPDSRRIAFFAQGKLMKVEASGGPVQALCAIDVGIGCGGSWSPQGTILFGNTVGPISRVSAEGGPASPVTTLDPARHEWSHLWPRFLPDGSHFLYLGRKPSSTDQTYPLFVATLDGLENRELFNVSSAVTYSDGRLLYLRDGNLVSRPFSPMGGPEPRDRLPRISPGPGSGDAARARR
jgi:hypothetical protein